MLVQQVLAGLAIIEKFRGAVTEFLRIKTDLFTPRDKVDVAWNLSIVRLRPKLHCAFLFAPQNAKNIKGEEEDEAAVR